MDLVHLFRTIWPAAGAVMVGTLGLGLALSLAGGLTRRPSIALAGVRLNVAAMGTATAIGGLAVVALTAVQLWSWWWLLILTVPSGLALFGVGLLMVRAARDPKRIAELWSTRPTNMGRRKE